MIIVPITVELLRTINYFNIDLSSISNRNMHICSSRDLLFM
jgi:hypothetical protein